MPREYCTHKTLSRSECEKPLRARRMEAVDVILSSIIFYAVSYRNHCLNRSSQWRDHSSCPISSPIPSALQQSSDRYRVLSARTFYLPHNPKPVRVQFLTQGISLTLMSVEIHFARTVGCHVQSPIRPPPAAPSRPSFLPELDL